MGVRKTDEQMEKINPRCQYKNVTLEKWLFKILN